MKVALCAMALVSIAPAARAEPVLEPYAPYKLVGVMPQAGQALLWDEVGGEYVVARSGDDLGAWHVARIDVAEGHVALERDGVVDDLRLVRLPRRGALVLAQSAAPAPPPPAPAPAHAVIAFVESRTIGRDVLAREIADFDKLMAAMTVARADGGGFRFVRLDPRSFAAAIGFREGDVVRRIAGETVSTVDDASRAYARLRGPGPLLAEVERGDERVTLRVDLK
jgi:type II secretory pathway component PulC